MGIEVVEEYRVSLEGLVIVRIVSSLEGKYRYVVVEPSLSENASKLLREVVYEIESDVGLLRDFSEYLSLEDAFPVALDVVRRVGKKYIKEGLVGEDDIRGVAYYIVRDFVGYGQLDPLLRDPSIEDITCDGVAVPIHVFHRDYEWIETNIVFSSVEALEKVVRKLAYRAGLEATIAKPIVEGVIKPEGYRVHIVLDTVSRRGHSFTVRKFRATPITIVELINRRTLDPGVAALLWLAVENKQGMIIYGPTGSGKTTLLNAIAMLLPPEMKIVTAEDTPEIMLPFHDNWVSMITRLSTDPYVQDVTLQAQVESAMRQRPDVLALGEIRSREAYSFFQAVSTGHGGLTTIHAESIDALIRRLVAPPMNVPKSLVSTTRLFIQILRIIAPKEGVIRRVSYIHETDSYDPRRDMIKIRTLVRWERAKEEWKIYIANSSTIRAIAELLVLDYDDVIHDLYRRATVLWWAAKRNLDLSSLHVLIREYRRDPDKVYKTAREEMGGPYPIKVLEREETREL